MTVTDWIVAVVAVLALVISILAFLYSRRATIASERSAAVLERQEEWQFEERAQRAVRWRFEWPPRVYFFPDDSTSESTEPTEPTNDRVTMLNEGDGTAYDVRVELNEGGQVIGGPLLNGITVHSNERVQLPASTAGYGRHKELTVSWRVTSNGRTRSRHFDLY
jgi:hypothetical protein